MGRSWNHTLRKLTDEEVAHARLMSASCSGPLCKEPATHEATFDSVTGGAGRVNTRRKKLCDSHARKFALALVESVGRSGTEALAALSASAEGAL